MANLRRFELDELATRPGTYVNPDTEIVIVVDDGGHVDAEILEGDGADWIAVSDEVPIDEHRRDELLERLQVRATRAAEREAPDEDYEEEEDDLEPDAEFAEPEDDY